jgi:hypothetical protein
MHLPRPIVLLAVSISLVGGWARESGAAEYAQIQQSIAKGASFLRSKIKDQRGGHRALCALALLKAGLPANAPEIQETIAQMQSEIDSADASRVTERIYGLAVTAVLMADTNPEAYKSQLGKIAFYLMETQREDGSWTYRDDTGGDTSVTHYCLLGLWACARAGIEIPPPVWEKSIKWHMSHANPDGGFAYVPGGMPGGFGDASVNMSINAIGSIGIAWVNLAPDSPPSLHASEPKAKKPEIAAPPPPPRNNDSLEAVPIEDPTATAAQAPGRVPEGAVNTMRRAFGWFAPKFGVENVSATQHRAYYYYSLERMTAMVDVKDIGGHDWYAECSDFLLSKQAADGSWTFSGSVLGSEIDTSFVVLSLVKSTAKLIKRTDPVATFGKGFLTGGRGLPDDLQNPDAPKKTNKKDTPLDQLLASLAKAESFDVQEVQEQLVEKVQIGDRQELIKQKDLLVKLIVHPDPEIRRTAAWALGRANDLSLARYLVNAIEDPDVDVKVEAHNALCWISRRPLGPSAEEASKVGGFEISLDPLEGLAPDAGPDVKGAALTAWRVNAFKLWGQWYLKNRPYKDRGDEFEAQLREKLATLN